MLALTTGQVPNRMAINSTSGILLAVTFCTIVRVAQFVKKKLMTTHTRINTHAIQAPPYQ